MTKPGDSGSGGHHRHHHHHHRKPPLCQEEDSPEKPLYRNIKPKVGHLFQSKVPKLGAALISRPAPDRYSVDIPHLTETQVENENNMDTESLPLSTVMTTSTTTAGYGPMHTPLPPTCRGGLLVHQPTRATNDFLVTTNPLPPSTSESWIQETLEKYGTTTTSGRGGRRKRKYSFAALPVSTTKKSRPPLEEDEYFLNYLTLRHDGNVDTAKLSWLVASGAGRAYRTRRSMHKQDHDERFRRPSLSSSQSWYDRLDRECPLLNQGEIEPIPSIQEDMKRVWKAVLACGQEMNKELETKQLLLSQVIRFLQNAYCLPSPEESYGTRHLVVEGISESMHLLLDHVTKAHDAQAKLLDILHDEENEGVDRIEVKKYIKELASTLTIRLDIMNVLDKQLDLANKWQSRMDKLTRDVLVADDNDDLAQAEELLRQASTLGIRWRGQVELEERVNKAYQLRDRLREWQKSCAQHKKESFKFVSGLVRDANRLNVNFPEVSELLRFHQTAEAWVERANVAVRSRISLTEIEDLVDRAEKMPLDLSEFANKLQNRIRQSQSWISEFQDLVPAPFRDGKVDNLAWMGRMRKALQTDDKRFLMKLNDIATEGTRIPVEIDCVKLLLVEIDAKEWSLKAVKWVPSDMSDDEDGANGGKKAKLVDIRDHLDKAEALRERLVLSSEERDAWVLEYEGELQSIIDAADDWYEKYQEYLVYDNRKNQGDRRCLSIATLRQIINEGNLIHANIGTAAGKMSRILGQAETWYDEFGDLLSRCGISASIAVASTDTPTRLATLEEVKAAVESADNNISLDLDEARALRELEERIQKWHDRVIMAAPRRIKRVGKRKGRQEESRYTVDDLVTLINEASSLPINTDEDTERLRQQLYNVHEWRTQARRELGDIASSFRSLRQAVISDYGLPDEFYDEESRGSGSTEVVKADQDPQLVASSEPSQDQKLVAASEVNQDSQAVGHVGEQNHETQPVKEDGSTLPVCDAQDAPESVEDSSQADTSQADSEIEMEGGGNAVCKMISSLLKSSKLTGIRTSEEELTELLEKTAKWILKSLKYIDSPKDVYDKKVFRSFDEFVRTGEELLLVSRNSLQGLEFDDAVLLENLGSSSGDLVSDQLVRLKILKAHRDKFIAWFQHAQEVLSSKENRATLDVLNALSEQSRDYPSRSDMVQKVRHVAQRARKWKEAAGALFDSDEKPTMQEARELLEASDKLNLICDEVKVLRNAVRTARAWVNKVKRCKLDQEGANSTNVTKLLREHDALLLSMPSEFSKLNQALKGYCLCRQPYDGFMIGCDGCGEWYHGPCVGVSEARAGRCDKFLCVRCSLKRAFKSSASTVATFIRNWSDLEELKKTRHHESQKHQRKVRKEKRDIETLAAETESLAAELNGLGDGTIQGGSSEAGASKVEAAAGVAVSPCDSESNDEVPSRPVVGAPESVQNQAENSGVPPQMNGGEVPVPAAGVSTIQENEDPLNKRKQEIEAQLNQAAASVKASGDRLTTFTVIASERKRQEDREDEKRAELQRWCIRVRSLVLVPSTMERAAASLPSSDGSLSAPMLEVLKEATILGIRELPVVAEVENAFKCIAWCCYAMPLLAKRPSLQQIDSILSKGADLTLPEVMPLRMLKGMAQRARTWQTKAVKALAPKPYETDPVSVDSLKRLIRAASDIPLSIPGEACVQNVIDDKGTRYCICGGPHFGSFMLGCDRCERWYHGRCVNVNSKQGDALSSWLCPPCRGVSDVGTHLFSAEDFDYTDDEGDGEDMTGGDEDNAMHAPLPEELWPPCGLLNTQDAVDALGANCCAIPDDTDSFPMLGFSQFSDGHAPTVYNSLFTSIGNNMQDSQGLNAFNPYMFGGNMSNGASSATPVFANAFADRASSILSSGAALTSAHGFHAIAASQEADSSMNDSSGAHGFHGIASTLGGGSGFGTNGFQGFAAAAPREASSSTNASSENLASASSASPENLDNNTSTSHVERPREEAKKEAPSDEEEKKEPPRVEAKASPCKNLHWQPPIMHAASGDHHPQAGNTSVAQNGNAPVAQSEKASAPLEMDTSAVMNGQHSSGPMELDPTPDISMAVPMEQDPTPMTQDEALVEISVQDKAA